MKFDKFDKIDALAKAIAEAVEEEKKAVKMSSEMASATVEFTNAIVRIADKYDMYRLDLMRTASMSLIESCFDIDWESYDPETGKCKVVE